MAEGESFESTAHANDQISATRYHPDVSTRRMSKRMQEHTGVDLWLEEKGYYRKDTPKDPTCLFRAVSEQVYHTQYYHIRVRKECVAFMKEMRHLFEESISVSYEHYLEQMACFTEWGGMNEIRAMSLLYKRDVIIFNGQKQMIENVTNGGFDQNLLLCYTPPKQYETVLSLLYVKKAAYCQSLVYGTLYECVFNMAGIMHTADKMLHDRNIAFRHDRFFQKGNLEIREQLTADLYNRVESDHIDADEVQFNSRGIPPIPYKIAKALSPDIYRNTDFDTWHEIKREVKYGGWNRNSNNELQVGGKCLISLNYLIDQAKSNYNSSQPSTSGNNAKNVPQKTKQDKSFYFGYIQGMGTNEEPALVFVEELGEMRLVPYAALKPFPLAKRNKQGSSTPHNRKNIPTDAGRRWKKTYNSTSRKRKDAMNITNPVIHNTSRNGVDSINIKSIDKADFKADVYNDESSKVYHEQASENHDVKDCVNHATNEIANNPPTAVAYDNSQPLKTINAAQEVSEERKNSSPTFTKHHVDNGFVSKPARSGGSNNYDNSYQNTYSKAKMIDENYCPPNINPQINIVANPDLFYVFADGSSCPVFPFLPRNFGDFDQTDHFIPPKFAYNSGTEYLRVNQTWNYGSMPFGPNHSGAPPEGTTPNGGINNVPYMRDEVTSLVNGVQNCSLTCNETGGCNVNGRDVGSAEPIVYKAPFPYINGVQNTKHSKQGTPRNLGGKDFSYQVSDKKHGGIANKGNRARYQQNNRDALAYAQYWSHYGAAIPTVAANDARIVAHMQRPQHSDPMVQQHQQQVANAPFVLPPNNVIFYPNDAAEACCNSYYVNSAFLPVACFPPYHDAPENAAAVPPPSYPHLFPQHSEAYPPAPSYPSMIYPPAPPQMQFPAVIQQQQQQQQLPPPPTANVQEHWYPMVGPPPSHFVQYAAPSAPVITEQPCNGHTTGGSA
ncbi:PREDICTED: uncharacterized protein LOC106747926 isoform X2 [Dinoponera quadriceps]|uniref:Uncharacterized protein LOC106747926 isoform X2 n=1 Tax=Dinoponera quadriceps TaxID=609295 RepID=A0A6P3XSR1_DINQU|nr:PREDICTED: uncharacterized protein LOC106747926 isoform X2 [Dinoponera quadriceps]